MTNLSSPRRPTSLAASMGRQFALAVALASGTVVLAVPGFTDAAYAQKKKKKDEAAEASKPVYSKAFVDAYTPVEAGLKAPVADVAALKPQIVALAPLAVSPDEQLALGGMMYNAGITAKDTALHLQGAEMMLASGKVKPEEVGRFAFTASQLAAQLQQYDKARTYLQQAIDLNYSSPNVAADDLKLNMAEIDFTQERYAEGLKYLKEIIEARKASGQPVNPNWYRRGVQIAYTHEIVPDIYEFVQGWVITAPTPDNWRDAVNLTRNLNEFDGPVLLDLLRLGKQIGTLKDKNDYIFYVEAADTRRLPNEVVSVINQARETKVLVKGTDPWVDEQFASAEGLIAEDRAALPSLERDANKPGALLRTVLAAGDTTLSYGEYAKAAGFYEKALTMAGVDRDLALTRLGIAQIGAGNAEAARATLAQVQGQRAPIAMLWSAYANQTAGEATATGG